jgi:hypothetical protein
MVGVPISSTALIGLGGAQWYPHQPSGNRENHAARAPVMLRATVRGV